MGRGKDVEMEVVGTAEVPRYARKMDRYVEVVKQIPEDEALVVAFGDYESLFTAQRRLHDAALKVFGERGRIATRRRSSGRGSANWPSPRRGNSRRDSRWCV
jgi:hypothetical protein